MSPVQETNMFGCFPAVIVALVLGSFLFLGVQQSSGEMPTPEIITVPAQAAATEVTGGRQSLTVIEQIETTVSASMPATITLQVRGYHPDGCKFPVQVVQTRSGEQVSVTIYRVVPIDVMCTMELNPYNDTITLDGTFDSGDYIINVNGTIVQVKI